MFINWFQTHDRFYQSFLEYQENINAHIQESIFSVYHIEFDLYGKPSAQ